ncbi:MAG: rhomboid family intramembrane serine protease [Muribaculaceae bacterium]|nr:rhomboid family intramembrane serine protease [Muribaculaceae bacterium]
MPVTKHLLIINVIVWLATIVFGRAGIIDLERYLGLHFWLGSDFNPAQLFTYMFMHDTSGFAHIFFNMFSLWMFGSLIEKVLGSKRYLFYYISCGLGAALVQELVWQLSWQDMYNSISVQYPGFPADQFYNLLVTVGASGAVFGILLAFGMIFPNMSMYIIPFPFPIKAKWVVLGYGAIELFFGISHTMNGVAHYAHLGGMIAGILMILYWKHNGTLTRGNGFY